MHPTRLITLVMLAGLFILASTARSQQPRTPEAGVVRHWNEAVETIEAENRNFLALLETYKRNPPGRVLLTPDVRQELRKRRLRLISDIVASHENRIRALQELAKAEEASQ